MATMSAMRPVQSSPPTGGCKNNSIAETISITGSALPAQYYATMSSLLAESPAKIPIRTPGLAFASGFAGIVIVAAMLSAALPVEFAIATVFLFAGPHNWFEVRYILGRLPARAGKLRVFLLLSLAGVVGFTATYSALPLLAEGLRDTVGYGLLYALWNTALLVWIAALVWMRSRTKPRFDSGWVWPAVLLISAGAWLNPFAFNLALVYLHPLLALVLLDLELGRSHRSWRPLYRTVAILVPVCLGVLWQKLHDTPDLPGVDPFNLTLRIADHAGASLLSGVSTHFLVGAHTFLEMVHYAAWIVLIPLVGMRSLPWELRTIPAARQSSGWSRAVGVFLLLGLAIVVLLWICFGLDYGTTRSVYFSVALLHVLAEIPFLLRMV
jgi:hypothetical protein